MPANYPFALFSDLKPDSLLELGNRFDLDTIVGPATSSRLDRWYRNSYIELCMNVPLETLEVSQAQQFIQGVDTYNFPANCRLPKAITVNITPGGTLYPGSSDATVIVIDWKDINYIRSMTSQQPGPPSIGCIYGNQVIIRPVPDYSYSCIWDCWQLPQIANPIANTKVMVPPDWNEIVDMGALMRGFKALLERDKARELQELLYGFKTDTGKVVPGYITFRQTQDQAMAPFRDYGLQPRSRRYTG